MQRQYVGTGRAHRVQRGLHTRDLALARQEHQHVARMRRQRVFDRAPRLRFQRLLAPWREMRDLHRKPAALAGQARRAEERGQALAVEGGRHHHDAQVLTQPGLHVQRQCQAEVGRQVALVELVEQQRADAVQQRVVLQHAGEDAFGDDLDAGTRGDPVLEADAVADGLADRLAELPRHELGGTARGDATRFQHHDPAAMQPRRVEQRQRHLGGLAGAGRGFEYQPRVRGQAVGDGRQQRGNGEVGACHRARIRVRAGATAYNARFPYPHPCPRPCN